MKVWKNLNRREWHVQPKDSNGPVRRNADGEFEQLRVLMSLSIFDEIINVRSRTSHDQPRWMQLTYYRAKHERFNCLLKG